jgi:hypothetical protein
VNAPRRINWGPGYPTLELLVDDYEGRKQILIYLDGSDEPAAHLKLRDGALTALLPGDGAPGDLARDWDQWYAQEGRG